eukprot:SM000008S22191  [mRNA]  locus=s8:345422:346357:- [translate_table: standard]
MTMAPAAITAGPRAAMCARLPSGAAGLVRRPAPAARAFSSLAASLSGLQLQDGSRSLRCPVLRGRAAGAAIASAAGYGEEEDEESEVDVEAAYQALYGKAFSGVEGSRGAGFSVDGAGDDDDDAPKPRRGRKSEDGGERGGGKRGGAGGGGKDALEERVVQIRRVTKVVKGGKQMAFRAVVVVGDRKGRVGVGVGKAKEVISAVQKSATDARRHMVTVPMTKYLTFPHRALGQFGAAQVMLRPAATGTGVIAGGSVRIVLELAGVENALGKELGSGNPLNNARAVLQAVSEMKQFRDVARDRNIPMEELWK